MRWGFNYQRRCLIPTVCRNLLIRLPGTDEVFAHLDYRDFLHGVVMFLGRMFCELLDYIPFEAAARRTLDERLACLGRRRYFRDPSGVAYRRQKTLFVETDMSGHDRVQLLFLLPHVFGPVADNTLPDARLHQPLLTAVARTQLIIIAGRGLRCYTQSEFRDIFDKGFLSIFGSLQYIRTLSYQILLAKHQATPTQYKKPADLPGRPDRCSDQSDTADTDDDSQVGGHCYSHGFLSLIHQHWVKQVVASGSFNVHDTQSAEAAHKTSAKLAGIRVRHLNEAKTLRNMSTYLRTRIVFDCLKDFFPDPPPPVRPPTIKYGVRSPLFHSDGTSSLMMSAHATNTQLYQRKLLHDEVPVTRVEFMDMLCDELRLPKTLATYVSFTNLCFEFGQSFTCSDGKTFWATDSRYPYSNEKGQRMRRDRFSIEGSSKQTYRLTDGRRVERLNSLCGEATCFVIVRNLQCIDMPALDPITCPDEDFPQLRDLRAEIRNNSITFFFPNSMV